MSHIQEERVWLWAPIVRLGRGRGVRTWGSSRGRQCSATVLGRWVGRRRRCTQCKTIIRVISYFLGRASPHRHRCPPRSHTCRIDRLFSCSGGQERGRMCIYRDKGWEGGGAIQGRKWVAGVGQEERWWCSRARGGTAWCTGKDQPNLRRITWQGWWLLPQRWGSALRETAKDFEN